MGGQNSTLVLFQKCMVMVNTIYGLMMAKENLECLKAKCKNCLVRPQDLRDHQEDRADQAVDRIRMVDDD